MDLCCQESEKELARALGSRRRVLQTVLAINAALFLIEFAAGWLARSSALLGDSLDMLGDAAVYGFSLYVLQRSSRWQIRAARTKGILMVALAITVLAQAAVRLFQSAPPVAEAMGVIGILALSGNALCCALLYRHRGDGLNMRSTWLCSRNDLIANTAVLAAAGAVALTASAWPDLLVGVAIAALFLRTGMGVLRDSAGPQPAL